ncbi:MAG: CBS domain-containing protein [Nitrososphaerota archaeon]|uniref:CBS domain-containing protein n=1 Tax=Candidatus Bathycorpusculum sp. TaxID=2994959 RepID=UPI002838AF41|nr:CBS domain-containing protein [Candidatus Termitimicrobium sp.]MCL2431337.1 CBS domain-containing protein [Candidatus Termitimicrobium sp.]MDR0493796.1 CBS domain-containing protein [Nitrososphaerota archaeon]
MSEKDVMRFLQILCLSKREIQVYMFLAKSGVQSTSFVAKRLKMERVQAYRTFKKLQEKGFIEATLERPTRFTIVPFSALVDNYITTKKNEVTNLNEQKQSLLTAWQAISAPESEYPVAKFSIITGKKKIHSKMLNMIEEAKSEVIVLTTSLGLIQEDIAGIFDATVEPSQNRGVQVQILTDVSLENFKVVERFDRNITEDKLNIKLRHVTMSSKFFPRFLIKDEEEAILYAPFGNEASVLNLEDEGLWINDKMFISVLKAFFVQMWQSGVEASKRIEELKSGVPLGETVVIKDAEEAWNKVGKILEAAKKEIVIITSSQSINRLAEDNSLIKFLKEDLKIRLMASIDLDNLEPAQKLAAHYEVKHVPISYMTMMLVDNKHLFMFKNPPINDIDVESALYLADTFYTSDPSQIERVSEMLDDIWKRGIDISEITSQAGTKLPTVEVEKTQSVTQAVERMLQNNVTSVLITEQQQSLGVISDRDILREIIEEQKDPQETSMGELKFTPLILLETDESMITAMKLMEERGFKRAAMVKDGQLIGMLTKETAKNKG